MRNGTQEELDAAREDMTLLPFAVRFKVNAEFDANLFRSGDIVIRHIEQDDDAKSIAMYSENLTRFWYMEWQHLEVINDN